MANDELGGRWFFENFEAQLFDQDEFRKLSKVAPI